MKIQISLSANIYNQDDLSKFLNHFKTRPNVDKWLTSTLKTHLLNTKKYHIIIKSLPPGAPVWATDAISKKELYKFVPTDELIQQLEHAIGWLKTLPETKVLNVSVEEAIRQGDIFIESENKKVSLSEGEISVLHQYKNGYQIVSCLDAQALKREGKIMQHCVGNEEQNYIQRVGAKTLQIWSLRDSKNNPHCTIEYDTKEKRVVQIKGKQNLGVVSKYQHYVIEWLKKADQDNLIEEFNLNELRYIGILAQDDIWYDINRLPKNFNIKGNLRVTSSMTLPVGLNVRDSLYLNKDVVKLPSKLTVGVDLDASESKIELLPEDLKVGRILNLSDSRIRRLPEDFEVGDKLILSDCHNLTELPNNLTVGGALIADDCINLAKIGESSNIDGSINFKNCSKLVNLPQTLRVGNHLLLVGCSSLLSIPDNYKIPGCLYVSNCTSLRSIGKNVVIGSVCDLHNADSLQELPSNIIVNGGFVLPDGSRASSVPEAKSWFHQK